METKLVELNPEAIARHNGCLRVLGPMLATAGIGLNLNAHEDAALKWLLLESMALMVGKQHGLEDQQISEQVERMADNIINGGHSYVT